MSQTISYIDSALGLNEDPRALLRKLFWTGLLCLTLLLILATYGVYRAYSWRLIESAHAEAKATCQVLLIKEKKHLFSMDERGQARLKLENSEQASFEKRLQNYFQPLAIDTVRIWNLHRQVVNHTGDESNYRTHVLPPALDQALAGQSVSLLGKANAVGLKGKEGGRAANQVISYLPIWGRNKEILGAIEIRRSVESYRGEIRRGVTFFALLLGSALLALLGCVFFLVSKSANRLAKTQQVLRSLATTDSLTGLYNRREILAIASDRFSKEQENKRHKTPVNLGLLMLDFDNFKEINDTYGHPVGDQVLQVLATRIRCAVRPYDIIGRVGGEEFLVVLPDSCLEQCQEIAERLCKTVREQPFEVDGLLIRGSISIGGATAQPMDRALEVLLQRADKRLYQAKTRGKDRVSWADEAVFYPRRSCQSSSC
jgi:diguanylate cyclase (GGDEF)-like protein